MLFDPQNILGFNESQRQAQKSIENLLEQYESKILNADQLLNAIDAEVLSLSINDRLPFAAVYYELYERDIIDEYVLMMHFV